MSLAGRKRLRGPFFDYRGTLRSMAAFKAHRAFGFWKASLLLDDKTVMGKR